MKNKKIPAPLTGRVGQNQNVVDTKFKIGKLPRSIRELARYNNIAPEVAETMVKKLQIEGIVTPVFVEVSGVKVCLWKRKAI